MVTSSSIVKIIKNKKGNSYLEIILSLFILINIFVLMTQMFYNVYNNNNNDFDTTVLDYEAATMRIEQALKEVTFNKDLVVEPHYLEYTKKDLTYRYGISNNHFALTSGAKKIYYIYDVKTVNFLKISNVIYVTFIDIHNRLYETKIILSFRYK